MRIGLTLLTLMIAAALNTAKAQNGSPAFAPGTLLKGQQALDADWRDDIPGLSFYFTVADLPDAYATPSAGNDPKLAPRPDGAWPQAPAGFVVEKVVDGLTQPRKIITAPNGDLFVVESAANDVRIIRQHGSAPPTINQIFVTGLNQPFGMAFYPPGPHPQYFYVANTDSLVRYPYRNGDLTATGPAETLVEDISGGGRLRGGGHWTRDIAFSKDGSKLFLSIGSKSNVEDSPDLIPIEQRRARIFEYNPDGTGEQVYAHGIRNPVGLAINPSTGELWMSVNERDALGDNLVPDYISHVTPNGFYGWPWFWMGGFVDKRALGEHTETAADVITPDVLLQPHSASLSMIFYVPGQFPREYNGDAFACEHGSWNRSQRTGYKVIRVFMKNGKATGVYQDFLTGFVINNQQVWGRPVGVTEGKDGSLYVTDDGSGTLWHVRYVGSGR